MRKVSPLEEAGRWVPEVPGCGSLSLFAHLDWLDAHREMQICMTGRKGNLLALACGIV